MPYCALDVLLLTYLLTNALFLLFSIHVKCKMHIKFSVTFGRSPYTHEIGLVKRPTSYWNIRRHGYYYVVFNRRGANTRWALNTAVCAKPVVVAVSNN